MATLRAIALVFYVHGPGVALDFSRRRGGRGFRQGYFGGAWPCAARGWPLAARPWCPPATAPQLSCRCVIIRVPYVLHPRSFRKLARSGAFFMTASRVKST